MAFLLECFDEAEALLKRTVAFLGRARRRNLGKLFNAITNLAHLYESHGDLESALVEHQRALEVRENALDPNHPDLAGATNNLGALQTPTCDNPPFPS